MIAIAENEFPTVSEDFTIQREYLQMRGEGTSHNLAEMFALQQGPALDTDGTFTRGKGTLRDQFKDDEVGLMSLVRAAKRQGYTPNATDIYDPQLAQRRGDPKAFVPYASGGKGHVRKVCEERGLACHGAVKVKRKPGPPPKDIPLAENLVVANAERAIHANPDMGQKPWSEVRRKMIEKHGSTA